MQLLVVGDLHITPDNLDETELLLERLLTLIEDHPDITSVVFMGDTLDRFQTHDGFCVKAADVIFRGVAKVRNIIILIGNHDIPHHRDYMSSVHAFLGYHGVPGITVIDASAKVITIQDVNILCVPYAPKGRFREAMATGFSSDQNLNDHLETIDLVLAHQEIRGCVLEGSLASTDGDRYRPSWPLLVSGHIHTYQRPQDNVWYVGSPRQVKFNDTYDDKTVSLLTLDPTSTQKWSEQRFPLNLKPRIHASVSADDFPTWTPPENCHLKITITGTCSEISTLANCKLFQDLKARKIPIHYNYVDESSDFIFVSGEREPSVSYSELLRRRFGDNTTRRNLLEDILAGV